MAAVVVGDALGAAEVLGQEVELVHGGLEGQLMQSLLRGAGGLWREGWVGFSGATRTTRKYKLSNNLN